MPKLSQQNWRSLISNRHLQKWGIYWLVLLLYLCWLLWIGEPIEITCQKVDSNRIDCTLTYQALLRSSKQEIRDIKGMDIDTRVSSSNDGGSTSDYVAVLRSKSGDRDIKTYSNRNDPELEMLNHRLNKFIKNPEEN
ncbi:MAG: hypothetical protein RMY34_36020 [Aulosira sp. DedQUE10]|nr:hypothetical protein [Aulosira sp. DedQUE10]